MTLIITNSHDTTTFEVIAWFKNFSNQPIVAICDQNEFEIENFRTDIAILKFKDYSIDIRNVKKYWYRKGDFYLDRELLDDETYSDMKNLLKSEVYDLHYSLHRILHRKRGIGNFFKGDLNRIDTLLAAAECNLDIPDFCVTSSKAVLATFFKKYEKIVIRSINQGLAYSAGGYHYMLYVNILDRHHVNKLPERFYRSLFMQYVEKEYEIRSFYLKGNFFSMAIFSQENERTKVDFRHYDLAKPNRTVPYKLPAYVEEKLSQLLRKLDIDTGSIDIIFSKEKIYYFLEINPVGQFGMVSKPCNYYLEREMAIELNK